jgi:peptidoglycan/LPS O-acetylase OafA/YrhL
VSSSIDPTSKAMASGETRIPGLDALRGLAAIGVAVHHYRFYFDAGPEWPILEPAYNGARFFVELFFVLSGYLLPQVYSHIGNYGELVVRRFARLFPLQWLTLLMVAAAQYLYSQIWGQPFIYTLNDGYNFLLNVLLLQQTGLQDGFSFNGPSWSISVEWIVNLVFFGFLLRPRLLLPCSFLLAVASVVLLAMSQPQIVVLKTSFGFLDTGLLRCGYGFFIGVMAAGLGSRLSGSRGGWLWDVLALAAGCLFLVFLASENLNTAKSSQILVVGFLLPLLVMACAKAPRVGRVLSIRPLTWLGDISYAVYLLHFPIQVVIFAFRQYLPVPLNSGEGLLAFVALVMMAAHLVFKYFEKPAQTFIRARLGRRTARHPARTPQPRPELALAGADAELPGGKAP